MDAANTSANDYACPWDPAKSQCQIKCTPSSPFDVYDPTGLDWDEQQRMWSRTVLQWRNPHELNGKVGDRFHYLTHSYPGSGHKWWRVAVPEALAERCGCMGPTLGLNNN